MLNPDNKTTLLSQVKLTSLVETIEKNPCHIATVNETGAPNLCVASNIKVLDDKTLLISNNEMIHTPDNIIKNKKVVLTSFNANWEGLRLTGEANYYNEGKYLELCNKHFKNETTTPKGAILIKILKMENLS